MELKRQKVALEILKALIVAHPNDYADQLSQKAFKIADKFIEESQKNAKTKNYRRNPLRVHRFSL
jgi:hypothetical protein